MGDRTVFKWIKQNLKVKSVLGILSRSICPVVEKFIPKIKLLNNLAFYAAQTIIVLGIANVALCPNSYDLHVPLAQIGQLFMFLLICSFFMRVQSSPCRYSLCDYFLYHE